jgi:hypothetical protein
MLYDATDRGENGLHFVRQAILAEGCEPLVDRLVFYHGSVPAVRQQRRSAMACSAR